MSEDGQGQSQEKFFMVGQSVRRRGVGGGSDGEGRSRTADGRKFLLLFRTTPCFLGFFLFSAIERNFTFFPF